MADNYSLITAAIQPRYSRDTAAILGDTAAIQLRFRTCSNSYDDPYSPVGLLFRLTTSLSLRPLSVTSVVANGAAPPAAAVSVAGASASGALSRGDGNVAGALSAAASMRPSR